MSEAVRAYRHVAASDEFKEIERALSKARHEEAQALSDARHEGIELGTELEREKWESIVAEKNVALADKDALIAKLKAQLGE
ncbi:MAG: hypothetical protein FWB75_04895 [Oscillospiraceae bacterium]|nr:hypothetical protein [Oscillospiraceae bacterium]